MDARKWFQVLVVGGGALACGEVNAGHVTQPVAQEETTVVVANDAGTAAADAGRVCASRTETNARFSDEPKGVCCIWGAPIHPCCP